jgi:hypothetical protein
MEKNTPSWLNRLIRRRRTEGVSGAGASGHPDSGRVSDCRQVRTSASDYIDGDTPPSLRERIVNHLGLCDDCDGWVKTLATTVGLVREMPQEDVPDSLKQKIREIPGPGG